MKEIGTISLEYLNNSAHFQFMSNVMNCALADANIVGTEQRASLVEALKTAVGNEDTIFVLSQKSFYTDEIAEADGKRDTLYSASKRGVKMYVDFPDTYLARLQKCCGSTSRTTALTCEYSSTRRRVC